MERDVLSASISMLIQYHGTILAKSGIVGLTYADYLPGVMVRWSLWRRVRSEHRPLGQREQRKLRHKHHPFHLPVESSSKIQVESYLGDIFSPLTGDCKSAHSICERSCPESDQLFVKVATRTIASKGLLGYETRFDGQLRGAVEYRKYLVFIQGAPEECECPSVH